jgi:hypothetical protein
MEPIKLLVVEDDIGQYICEDCGNYSRTITNSVLINNKKPVETYLDHWYYVEGGLESIKRPLPNKKVNGRYVLKNPMLANDKIPGLIVPISRDGEEITWYEYGDISSLYDIVWDSEPQPPLELTFETNLILKVERLDNPQFYYNIPKEYGDKPQKPITNKKFHHNILDRITIPGIALVSRPCSILPGDFYKIIREYVNTHINPKVARVSSDFDFHFKVEKLIPLATQAEYKVDINEPGLFDVLFSKKRPKRKKPKYETRYRTHRSVEVYNIAPKEAKYGATVIKGLEASSHAELDSKINEYLENLIEYINEPITDCPHCKGMGVVPRKLSEDEILNRKS